MTMHTSAAAIVSTTSGEVASRYGRWHQAESVVCWASGSKVFLAALARSLVTEGALAWDTRVGDVLGVPAPGHLTLTALVEHRSGLPRALPEQKPTLPDPYAGWTTERFDARVLANLTDLAPEPAPTASYSNVGYAVLARTLEVSQGREWIDLVRARVVEPLGVPGDAVLLAPPVASPTAGASTPPDGRTAVGPRSLRGRPVADWDVSTGPFAAAGGLCSTLPDMARILRAALDAASPLAPGDGPHAWSNTGSRAWHAGALFRTGSLLVVDTSTGAVGAAHAAGGLPGHGERYAQKALGSLVEATAAAGRG